MDKQNNTYFIAVDCGPFDTIQEAAYGELETDWGERGSLRARACTECYGAVDLKKHLEQLAPHASFHLQSRIPETGNGIAVGRLAAERLRLLSNPPAELAEGEFAIETVVREGQILNLLAADTGQACLYAASAYLEALGIQICMGGHNMLSRYLPPAKYYARHPDWFGLVNGKRSGNVGESGVEGFGDNFCTSNEEAVTELCTNIINGLAGGAMAWADCLNFWMLDNGTWCQCDACREAGNPSARLCTVVYRLNKAMKAARKAGVLNRDIKSCFPPTTKLWTSLAGSFPRTLTMSTALPPIFPLSGVMSTTWTIPAAPKPTGRCFKGSAAGPRRPAEPTAESWRWENITM